MTKRWPKRSSKLRVPTWPLPAKPRARFAFGISGLLGGVANRPTLQLLATERVFQSPPDPTMAKAAIEVATRLASDGLSPALHDISDGGLIMSVAELCIASQVGVTARYDDWRSLFCEDPHRFVAAVPTEHTEAVAAIAAEKLGTIPEDAGLLEEVSNLVECPTPFRGRFEERFLKLPDEVLVGGEILSGNSVRGKVFFPHDYVHNYYRFVMQVSGYYYVYDFRKATAADRRKIGQLD